MLTTSSRKDTSEERVSERGVKVRVRERERERVPASKHEQMRLTPGTYDTFP